MSWDLAIGFILGEIAGIVIMAILSGRLDRRMELKEKKRAADAATSTARRNERRKEFTMKYYNTRYKKKAIVMLAIVLLAVVAVVVLALLPAEAHTEPDVVYPMVNQGITWEGAGYNGIWGR